MSNQICNQEYVQLLRLSRELFQIESFAGLVHALPSMVEEAFGARLVVLDLVGYGQFSSKADQLAEDTPELGRGTTLRGKDQAATSIDQCAITLRAHGKDRGILLVHGNPLTHPAQEQIRDLVGLALERAQSIDCTIQIVTARENALHGRVLADSIVQELRTRLTAIKGAATSLLWIELSLEVQRELLTIINEESDRIDRLISAVAPLDHSLHLQPVSMRK